MKNIIVSSSPRTVRIYRAFSISLAIALLAITSITAFADYGSGTGPGGVGATDGTGTLELWRMADEKVYEDTGCSDTAENSDAVVCWADQSGNGSNATQSTVSMQPTWQASVQNSLPVLRLDGGDYLATSVTPATGDNSRAIVAVIANGADSGDSYQHIAHYGIPASMQAYGLLFQTWNHTAGTAANMGNHYWSADWKSNQGQTSSPTILIIQYNGSQDALFVNDAAMGTNTVTTTTVKGYGLKIGSRLDGTREFYQGDIAELMAFSAALNSVERILVENYLSAKYNITLSANDHYSGDDTGNGDYDFDVAGVGQDSGNSHTEAHSAGMIVQNNTFLADNGDWLLFGHKTTTNANTTSDVPTTGDWNGTNDQRWTRHWYIDVTDNTTSQTGGTVDIIFDFSEAGMSGVPAGSASNYRLLKRSGTTGQFSDIATASSISGDQVTFSGVSASSLGSNFTLGTIDSSTSPTVITLQSLTIHTSINNSIALVLLVLVLGGAILVWRLRHAAVKQAKTTDK